MISINGSARLRLYKRSAHRIVGRTAQPGMSRWELEDLAAPPSTSFKATVSDGSKVIKSHIIRQVIIIIVSSESLEPDKSGVVIVSATEDPEAEWQ